MCSIVISFIIAFIRVRIYVIRIKVMSNSTEEAGPIEAYLQGTSAACVIFYSKCTTRKCLILRMKANVTETAFTTMPFDGELQCQQKVI